MTEEELLRRSIEHLHGPAEGSYGEDELVVVCIVRDGRPYVKSFVEHYFSLGAKHIAFLDNNSADGTVEALRNYDNVTVLRTKLPYKATGTTAGNSWTREVLFKQYVISRFGTKNRWCLCVDIDELFDYPYSDVVGLNSLLRYLNSRSYTAVAAQMLDMFSEEPLSSQINDPDVPLKESHRFYDISNIDRKPMKRRARRRNNTLGSAEIESFRYGIRNTVFGTTPYLTKFPLVFLDGRVRPMDGSSHRISGAAIADFTGVLFHYKFVDEHFHGQVAQAVREEHRLRNSAIYKRYMEVLDKNPSLLLKQETSRELKDVNDVLESQFLVVSDDYVSWVNAEEEKSVWQTSPGEPRELVEAVLDSRRRDRAKTLRIQRLERRLREAEHLAQRDQKRRSSQEPRGAKEPSEEPDRGHIGLSETGTSGDAGARRGRDARPITKPVSDSAGETVGGSVGLASGSELLRRAKPLFVGGCASSGTTAFADYLNQHEEVLLCQERYKGRQRRVSWDLFTFERIMDFRPEEMERPPGGSVERYIERHAELLARKDPKKLRWLGDKGPFYVRYMDRLAGNNPGARFIVLYRPLEEVAESWDARAKNPEDPWRSDRGFKEAVETWNAAMRKTREFIEGSPRPRVLIITYHDFFYRNEAVVPQISRFLGIDFDEAVTKTWRETSRQFEGERRRKEPLNEGQQAYIKEHADRDAEAWVLDRIDSQWSEPGLYVEEDAEAALASLDETEAEMWRLRVKVEDLKLKLARRRRGEGVERLKRDMARARAENRRLEEQLRALQGSRAWRVLDRINRLRTRVSVK